MMPHTSRSARDLGANRRFNAVEATRAAAARPSTFPMRSPRVRELEAPTRVSPTASSGAVTRHYSKWATPPMATLRAQLLGQQKSLDRRRLMFAFVLSLFAHALLLRMTFDGQGLGLPSFSFFWQER